jgi:DNA repair exonuclease SbcCD ATPase subunit
MIILKHLKVERFKLLREIDLNFPPRGSILVQGPNEAGKSTLFESIYFALYGASLVTAKKKHAHSENERYDDLVLYGENEATVTLVLTIGPTELLITRHLERGKGQSVALSVRKLGISEEEQITNLDIANARIIDEIGQIDGATLRNSCFIEQKSLNRLEQLSGSERETTLHKLLGLEKLTRLNEKFQVTAEDERLLAESVELFQLAEIQNRIPGLSIQIGELEAALDAVTVRENLNKISQQETEIAEQELNLEELRGQQKTLKGQLNRVQQLRKVQSILEEIIAAYETIAGAQRELPELEHQLTDIERREREDLPILEQQVHDLSDLTHSFGTLERMAADLLIAVNTIKDLEQELKQDELIQQQLAELDEQIIHTRLLVDEVEQSQHELEAQFRSTLPRLEARLQRLQALSERFTDLEKADQEHHNDMINRTRAVENSAELAKVNTELQEAEQELTGAERENQLAQEQTADLEKRWRQFNIRHQLEGWQRQKGLAQGLADAEQQVKAAHDQQEQLTLTVLALRRSTTMQLGIFIACIGLLILCSTGAVIQALHQSYIFATIAGLAAFLLLGGAGLSLRNYQRTRKEENQANRQAQEAINRVGAMVAARETALHLAGSQDVLAQIEREIHSLGGTVPHSSDEAAYLLQQIPVQDENPDNVQNQLTDFRSQLVSAKNKVNAAMEAVAALQKKQTQLQDSRKAEGWDDIDEKVRMGEQRILHLRGEITKAAGEEGLPIALASVSTTPDAEDAKTSISFDVQQHASVEEAIESTEHEISILNSKKDELPELVTQLQAHQDTLDNLLSNKLSALQQHEQFQARNPLLEIERAREQRNALREALRTLQDSLRQRVQLLDLSFGQTAVSTAETAARKQLELLHLALGRKLEIQDRYTEQATLLKESQESLSDFYRQLAKYSSSLGSWVIPPNPFAEALQGLQARCEYEIQEANEPAIMSDLENLKIQRGTSQTKIDLSKLEIEQAHERIAMMLAQRNRPPAKAYTLIDISAVWPLVGQNTPEDRSPLEDQLSAVEMELRQLEQQELEVSTRLQTGRQKLDLEQSRKRMQQQERNYQTKKRGGLLIGAAIERLMRKMIPQTEHHMQQLLPLLTRGRYLDVSLSTEPEEGVTSGGAFQLSVWEPAAAGYIPQSDLSGGTADQISLALRLAFAIASLPRELSAAPGFLLLDEPLSLASPDRMQALIDLVTDYLLSQHFEQTFFISHSSAIDPAMFSYHLYIDDGVVMESNLPPTSSQPRYEIPDGSERDQLATPEQDHISSNSMQDLRELTI